MRDYMQSILLTFFLYIFLIQSSYSETLMGVVKDAKTGMGVGGLTVKVLNTAFQTTTSPDGSYVINEIPEGVYSLLYGGPNYGTKILPSMPIVPYIIGDADNSGEINIIDAVYLVNYLFRNGPEPQPIVASGDANCDGDVNIADVVYIINYIFNDGPAPPC